MNLLHQALPWPWCLAGGILLLPALLAALWTVRHDFMPDPVAQHAWLGGAVMIALLWRMRLIHGGGIDLGLLGVAVYALMFGWGRSFLGLALALILHTALTAGPWINLGVNGLLFALWPSLVADRLRRALATWLPNNFFVYIFGNGLVVNLLTTILASLPLVAAAYAVAPPQATMNLGDTIGYALLLAWGEALIGGLLFSALVVFLPRSVLTFDADIYLPLPPRS